MYRVDICGVYAIFHTRSWKRYIGSAAGILGRWSVHKWGLRHNKHHCHHLQRAWNKYGERSFKFMVLVECGIDELAAVEQKYMDRSPKLLLMNSQPNARSCRGFKHSSETRIVMSTEAVRIGNLPEQKKMRSERAKKMHAEGKLGRKKPAILKVRMCKKCGGGFTRKRNADRTLCQSKYCEACRPPVHYGGNYLKSK